jgi:HK97 family phage portal protein
MPITPTLGLDLPTFSEIKAEKALRFPTGNGVNQVIIYPNMNSMQDAILRAISPQSQPSDDPHLSSLVAAGITWLANTLPEPDLLVKKSFQRKRAGKKRDDDVIEKHPFYDLMDAPNPEDTGSDLWKAFAYSWIIKGNVYFLKIRNAFGQVVRIYYEPHHRVQARWVNDKNGEYLDASRSESVPIVERSDDPRLKINYFQLLRDGVPHRVEPADIIHFKDGIDPLEERYGISRIATILREIYGDSAVASYAADLLGGNGVIPYVLGIDDKEGALGQEDFANIKAKLIAQTTGQNAGQPLVVGSRITFERTGLTPQELDLRTSRYMAQEVFSAVTGIPSIVLNFGSGMERSIYNNMSEADRRAVTSYLQPIWWHRDQVLTRHLLRDVDQNEQLFVESDLSEVGALQEDENDKVSRIGSLYEKGIIKRSEARTEFNYEVAPDGADDVYYVRGGAETVTIEQETEARENPEPEPRQLPEGTQPRLLTAVAGKSISRLSSRSEQNRIREHWERHAPERVKGLISARAK